VALPFMVAGLAIPTLFGPNLQIIDGLKPFSSVPPFPQNRTTFQQLVINVTTQGFIPGLIGKDGRPFACDDKGTGIGLITDSSSSLNCTKTATSSAFSSDITSGMVMCALTIACDVVSFYKCFN